MKYVTLIEFLQRLIDSLLWFIGYTFAKQHKEHPVFSSLYKQARRGWEAGLNTNLIEGVVNA